MTLSRAKALEAAYKSQFEDKAGMATSAETEDTVKMLIFNLCKEIKQIFVIFLASADFTTALNGERIDSESELAQHWLTISRVGPDFASLREDEQ